MADNTISNTQILTPDKVYALLGPHSPGYVVIDSFCSDTTAQSTLDVIRHRVQTGNLKPAGMGDISDWTKYNRHYRGDLHQWITEEMSCTTTTPTTATPTTATATTATATATISPATTSPAITTATADDSSSGLQSILFKLKQLHRECAGSFTDLSLQNPNRSTSASCQITCFNGDQARYVKHRDISASILEQLQATNPSAIPNHRILTAIYYPNIDWNPHDGGQLRIYLPSEFNTNTSYSYRQEFVDIVPKADRLVLFLSELLEHEVLPCSQPRFAISFWMYGTGSAIQQRLMNAQCSPFPIVANKRCTETVADTTSDTNIPSIFVAIPSYSDPQIVKTLQNMYATARIPRRVFVGIVEQIDETFPHVFRVTSVISQLCAEYEIDSRHIQVITMPTSAAGGVVWARFLAFSLYTEQTYVLSIDSHMRFVQHWDDAMIMQLHWAETLQRNEIANHQQDDAFTTTNNKNTLIHPNVVLTTYPPEYSVTDPKDPNIAHDQFETSVINKIPRCTTLMMPTHFGQDGFPRFKSIYVRLPDRSKKSLSEQTLSTDLEISTMSETTNPPIHTKYFAAGFAFARANVFIHLCPPDPHLRHLFIGEETTMLMRLLSAGVDMYTPGMTLVYHLWQKNYRVHHWSTSADVNPTSVPSPRGRIDKQESLERAHTICTQVPETIESQYRCHTIWSLDECYAYTGINMRTKQLDPDILPCDGFSNDWILSDTQIAAASYAHASTKKKSVSVAVSKISDRLLQFLADT